MKPEQCWTGGDGDALERAQADGRISTGDADEIRNFASFLRATTGVPTRDRDPEQSRIFREAYAEHYPEDYARAVAEHKAYAATLNGWLDDHPDATVVPVERRPAAATTGWLQRRGVMFHVDTDGTVTYPTPKSGPTGTPQQP